ncbi:MAG: PAS domain-containing protein, partial [Lysobacteraceae bacterium]
MPLDLARDLLQDRYTSVLRNTLRVLMAALPVVLLLAYLRGDTVAEWGNVVVFWTATCALYALLWRGHENWVAPGLVFTLVFFTTWHLVAYGSVRSGGVVGYACAVVAACMMLRRRLQMAVLLTCLLALGALIWAESRGLMTRAPGLAQVGATYWVTYAGALMGMFMGVSTSRRLAQQALRAQQDEFVRREDAERQRRRSEEQFSHIFQISPSGIMVQSVETLRVIDINPAMERMFGYPRDEYFAPAHNVLLWVDPEQRTTLLADLLRQGRLSNREMLCRHRDGTIFNALISSEIGGDPD